MIFFRYRELNIFTRLIKVIKTNDIDKQADNMRSRKTELVYQLTKDIYKEKSILIKEKM